MTSTDKGKAPVTDDDVDDLDDVLDQFTSKTPPNKDSGFPAATQNSPGPVPASSGRPRTNTRVDQPPKSFPGGGSTLSAANEEDEDEITKAFTKELEKEMENLVKDFASQMGPDTSSSQPKDDEEASRMLKAAWEAMLVEGMDSLTGDATKGSADAATEQAPSSNDFQEKIKQTMDKLKESNASAGSGSSTSNDGDDIQKLLAAAMSGLGGEGGDGEDEAELAGFLENMMGQLMSKEVLYEPLKDLEAKFPPYLANPPSDLSAEDRTRYDNQLDCVRKIIAVFDKPDYDDKHPGYSKTIMDLMSDMQAHGSPPTEIMGDMPPGFGLGSEGVPDGCTIS